MSRFACIPAVIFCALVIPSGGLRAEPAAQTPDAVDYVRDVAPLLAKKCARCHGAEKQESGLRLDSAAGLARGGDSGAAVVPRQAAASRLVRAVLGEEEAISKMPPEGPELTAAEIDLLRRWIDAGAIGGGPEEIAPQRANHWAFQPVAPGPLPDVKRRDWLQNPIDAYVLEFVETRGVDPSEKADRSTLLRRLCLDLWGLPPDPELVQEVTADNRPDAIERLIDRLLSAPAYGERFGRHWLDQARYADSNGYTRDFARDIWPFRDWVIRALNADLPFDQFTMEQFAGDLLPSPTQDQLVATGFHRNTLINEEGGTDQEQFRVEAVADRVATTGAVWLGLTLGCARCHSHKYDPISQREFYELFAFLNNCDEPTIEAPLPHQVAGGDLERRTAIRQKIARLEQQVEMQRAELESSQQAWEKTVSPEQRARLPGPVQVAYDMPFEKRDAANKKLIEDYYRTTETARKTFPLLEDISRLRESEPKIPKTMVLAERAEPRETFVHLRGDFLSPGAKVGAGVPRVLPALATTTASPNRLDLARWLVSPQQPLTPRVVMNRHWMYFFGRGLVETDEDFGTQGTPPTHPRLMDWLAREFVGTSGNAASAPWSMKRMHRTIACSATYQQVSKVRGDLARVDPRNEWWGRQNRLRVEAEIVRDTALAASGLLCRDVGGPSVHPPQPDGVYAFTQDPKPWNTEQGSQRYRRGMYTFFWRSLPYPTLVVFDAPNANVTCTRRLRSNTPLQALTVANDEVFVECARHLALRVLAEAPPTTSERVRYAFLVSVGRTPTVAEAQRLESLVAQQRVAFQGADEAARQFIGSAKPLELPAADIAAWTAATRVLLNLDEFITRE